MNFERPQRRRAGLGILLLATVAFASGCTILTCDEEMRSVQVKATGTAGSATTEAWLELVERRGGADAGPYVRWGLTVDPRPNDTVKAVRLRLGTPADPGEELYDLPMPSWPTTTTTSVVMRINWSAPYVSKIRFAEMWGRISREPTFVEAVFAGGSAPIGVGPLELTLVRDWFETCPGPLGSDGSGPTMASDWHERCPD